MRVLLLWAVVLAGRGYFTRPSPPQPIPAEVPVRPALPENLEIEVGYPITFYVHCGLNPVRFDGGWWTWIDGGGANPRPGWGNPFDKGTVVLIDRQHAIYTSSTGEERELVRGRMPPPPCM